MAFISKHTVICDQCNKMLEEYLPMDQLLVSMQEKGWKRGKLWNSDVHLCPECPTDIRVLWWDKVTTV